MTASVQTTLAMMKAKMVKPATRVVTAMWKRKFCYLQTARDGHGQCLHLWGERMLQTVFDHLLVSLHGRQVAYERIPFLTLSALYSRGYAGNNSNCNQ